MRIGQDQKRAMRGWGADIRVIGMSLLRVHALVG
jgi:hypothetical protein